MDSIVIYFGILFPAMLAGILVLSTHVPMGQEVLKRGIIFLDLAVAQMAALGLIVAALFGLDTHGEHANPLLSQLVAILAALAGTTLLYQFRAISARIQEALIGILFILAATGAILLLSKDPHGGERLKEVLTGQILWVEYKDLFVTAIVYLVVLLLWFKWREKVGHYGFYAIFAVTITLSTQLVGVYLVFASLIIPALATHYFRNALTMAYIVGIIAYFLGLLFSAIFDFPSGPMIAWSLAVVGGVFFLLHYYRANNSL
jgi:zinc/manganese transport system permease protein